jgi:UDP-2,3-diacylglucosamine hydrolase
MNLKSLGIIAGGGQFPDLIASCVTAQGTEIFGVLLDGDAEHDTLAPYPRITAKPEKMGFIFSQLRARGVYDLVLIGRMNRPNIWALRPDFTTLKLLPKILYALVSKGDDALLRAVRSALEREGFNLHGAHDFLKESLAHDGVMGDIHPDASSQNNIKIGVQAARALGAADAGQAVIVHDGRVIGRETRAGTDALIHNTKAVGGVLVKMAKPQQDRALDLPSIGVETIKNASAQGYKGLAVEAGGTLIAHKKQVIECANHYGLFLVGIAHE